MRIALVALLVLLVPRGAYAQERQTGPVSIGVQLAADAVFTEPALMPQASALLHVRADEEWSFRLLAGYAYVPALESPTIRVGDPRPAPIDPLPGVRQWSHRHMVELRPSVGYTVHPGIEAHLFVSLRYLALHYQTPSFMTEPGMIITRDEPLVISDGAEAWGEQFWAAGGTEWVFRPETSRRLEITVYLGLGGRTQVNPDGSLGLSSDPVFHGGTSLGWLFF